MKHAAVIQSQDFSYYWSNKENTTEVVVSQILSADKISESVVIVSANT